MKKVLCILTLLCAVCTGAWADAYQSGQLKDGMLIRFRSYYCNYYMSIGDQTNSTQKTQLRGYSARPTDGRDIFQLIGSSADGYKLYNQATGRYIGKANGGSNTTITDDVNQAGVYKFADATSNANPGRTGFTTDTKCVTITCTEGTAADGARCMHQSNTDGSVVTWSATVGSNFVITSACEMPEEGEYYCLRPYYTTNTYGYLYDNGTKLQANGTSESEAAIFRAEHVNGYKVSFRFVNTNKYLRWTQGFDATAKSDPNTGYNTDYNEEYNTMTIHPADNAGNQVNVQRNEYLPFLGLAAINGKGTDGNTYYFLPRKSDGGFVAGSANQLYFDNTDSGRTPYFKIEKVDMTNYVATLQTKINNAYDGNGKIGYPDMTSIATYAGSALTAARYEDATATLNNVYSNEVVKLPEDGKMYVLTAIAADANRTKHNLYESASEHKIKWSDYSRLEADGDKAKFICRKENDKFVFVNAATGHYLIWRGNGQYSTNATGYTETYSDHNKFTVKRAVYNSAYTNAVSGQSDLFGLVCIGGYRDDSHTSVCFLYSTNGGSENFQQDNSNDVHRFGSSHSSMFAIEEVENPNKVKLSRPSTTTSDNTGLNGKYVGTFSAPYNVKLPDGVVAYTANVNSSKNAVVFSELGNVVPKNTGVVVYAEGATRNIDEYAVPATETASVEGTNLLVGTNGADVTVDADVEAYILAADIVKGVKFYILDSAERTIARNKAYLDLTNAPAVNAFRFDFEEEQTTGIEAVESQQSAKQAYDLAGRSVKADGRGLYIIAGKKVIR